MLEERGLPGQRGTSGLLVTILVTQWLALALVVDRLPGWRFTGLLGAALLVWLCWHTSRGRFWARLGLAGLLMFLGAAALLSGVGVLALAGGLAPAFMTLGLLNVGGALALFLLPQVRAYFEAFRQGY